MSIEDLWLRQSVHGWVLFLGIKSVYSDKSERNYRGKCLGWPVTSYGGGLRLARAVSLMEPAMPPRKVNLGLPFLSRTSFRRGKNFDYFVMTVPFSFYQHCWNKTKPRKFVGRHLGKWSAFAYVTQYKTVKFLFVRRNCYLAKGHVSSVLIKNRLIELFTIVIFRLWFIFYGDRLGFPFIHGRTWKNCPRSLADFHNARGFESNNNTLYFDLWHSVSHVPTCSSIRLI